MLSYAKQKGFTLIEMIIVITLLGVIVAMSTPLLLQGLTTFSRGEEVFDAIWQGQLAIQRMSRDLRSVRSSTSITAATANTFAFTDVDNNTISYSLSGTSLTLTYNGNSAVLADGVQSLTFIYFDRFGATTTTLTAIRFIRVALNITQNNVNYTLTTGIFPRNLS